MSEAGTVVVKPKGSASRKPDPQDWIQAIPALVGLIREARAVESELERIISRVRNLQVESQRVMENIKFPRGI